jgi:hypothetical protein
MDKRKIDSLERTIRQKTGNSSYPPPGFFMVCDPAIETYYEHLLRQGYTLEQVNRTPVFIEGAK